MSQASQAVLSMEHVSKKFRRGEIYDSLRDLIPALVSRRRKKAAAESLTSSEFWALQDVSFSVDRGEAFGIIGSNGAGKSTILKLLSGIMPPTSGSINVRGKLSALIEVGAGFHPDLTGRENVFLNGTILGMNKAQIRAKFDEIVEFAGLAEFIDTPVKRYSSGMFARLGFSVAAHVEPDLLIVDEVLSVGDYLFQQKCVDRMNSVLRGGATVIFVSHNLHAVSALCKRSLLLERGRVVTCGNTDETIQQFLTRSQAVRPDEATRVEITTVAMRREVGSGSHLESGERVFVDVKIRARDHADDVTIVIQIVDENFYSIFDTDTTRLSGESATLRPGEEMTATFELSMHLAAGTYHVNAFAHQYRTDRPFHVWRSASTFFVGETRKIKGRANLYPTLAHYQVQRPDSEEAPRLPVPAVSPHQLESSSRRAGTIAIARG